jgi:hypothetical protein
MRLFQFASILLFASSSLFAADGASARLYLALGDSVRFGFIANAGFEYLNPQNFVGFPITSASAQVQYQEWRLSWRDLRQLFVHHCSR